MRIQPRRFPGTWRHARGIALVVGLAAVPGGAYAASVKGKAAGTSALLNPVWNDASALNQHRYTFREPSATVGKEARKLTGFLPRELCVAALGEGKPLRDPLRVVVAGGRTSPVTLVVAKGQQILFENHDPFPHKLYGDAKANLAAAELGQGKTQLWTPPGPGKYEIRDQLAPSVRSWIVVEPKTVTVAYPDTKGNFSIELEAGSYTLRGYFNGAPVGQELEIEVKGKPGEQMLKFPLAVGKDQG